MGFYSNVFVRNYLAHICTPWLECDYHSGAHALARHCCSLIIVPSHFELVRGGVHSTLVLGFRRVDF